MDTSVLPVLKIASIEEGINSSVMRVHKVCQQLQFMIESVEAESSYEQQRVLYLHEQLKSNFKRIITQGIAHAYKGYLAASRNIDSALIHF